MTCFNVMERTLPNGRVRSFDPDATGIDGSGRPVWLVYTYNVNGSLHLVERFRSKGEAANWVEWA